MNESEVEEHRIESGEEFLLITAKVSLCLCLCLWESANVQLFDLRSSSCKCCWFFQFPNVVDERKGGWGTQIREKGRVFANYHKGWRGVIGVEGRLISVSFLMCILGKEFHEWMWVNVNMWMNITVNLGRLVERREIQESVAENKYLCGMFGFLCQDDVWQYYACMGGNIRRRGVKMNLRCSSLLLKA